MREEYKQKEDNLWELQQGTMDLQYANARFHLVDLKGNPHKQLQAGDPLHISVDGKNVTAKVKLVFPGNHYVDYQYEPDHRLNAPPMGSLAQIGLPDDPNEIGNDFGKLYAGGTLLFDATSSGGIDLPEDDDYCTIIQAKPEWVGQAVGLPVEPGSRIDLGDGKFIPVDDLHEGPWDKVRGDVKMQELAVLKGTKVRICGSFDASQVYGWAEWLNDIEAFRHYDYFTGALDEGRISTPRYMMTGFTGTRWSALDSPVYFGQVDKTVYDSNYQPIQAKGYDLSYAFQQTYLQYGQPHQNNFNQNLNNALGWLNGEPIIETSYMFQNAASFNQELPWLHTLGYASNSMFENCFNAEFSMRRACAEHIPEEPYGWAKYQDADYNDVPLPIERPFWGAPC